MKTFRVYKHPIRGFEAVKVGFSWPAFFFGPFWMLIKKLWVLAILWFIASVLLFLSEVLIDTSSSDQEKVLITLVIIAASVALWLLPGFKGNKWREDNLTKRGYKCVQTVQADNPDAAVALADNSA